MYALVFRGDYQSGLIQVQVDILCEDICLGVQAWQKDVEGNVEIQDRISDRAFFSPKNEKVHK